MEREGAGPNYQGEQEDEEAAAIVFALGRPDRRPGHAHRQQLLLDAGRALMLWGWGAALADVVSTAARSRQPDAPSCAVTALLGLVPWLLGVFLIALVPVAHRFPRAARVGAALASAVVGCFFPPRN